MLRLVVEEGTPRSARCCPRHVLRGQEREVRLGQLLPGARVHPSRSAPVVLPGPALHDSEHQLLVLLDDADKRGAPPTQCLEDRGDVRALHVGGALGHLVGLGVPRPVGG